MTDSQPEADQPAVMEAHWDRNQVQSLFRDLAEGATIKHVQVRSTEDNRNSDTALTLEDASQAYEDGTAKAIQIYYEFDGQSWCDTLMIQAIHVRIIRTVGSPPPG